MRWNERWIWDQLSEQVTLAVLRGLRRAHKHTDDPSEDAIVDGILRRK